LQQQRAVGLLLGAPRASDIDRLPLQQARRAADAERPAAKSK